MKKTAATTILLQSQERFPGCSRFKGSHKFLPRFNLDTLHAVHDIRINRDFPQERWNDPITQWWTQYLTQLNASVTTALTTSSCDFLCDCESIYGGKEIDSYGLSETATMSTLHLSYTFFFLVATNCTEWIPTGHSFSSWLFAYFLSPVDNFARSID